MGSHAEGEEQSELMTRWNREAERLDPHDYESNDEFLFDLCIDQPVYEVFQDTTLGVDCWTCQIGNHDLCQETQHIACKCFRNDHEEVW